MTYEVNQNETQNFNGCGMTKYDPKYCDMLIEHMSKGRTYDTFATCIEDKSVNKRTLYRWEKNHPEFMDAKRRGYLLAKRYWEGMGEDLIKGVIKTSAGIQGWIFVMRCRFAYSDISVNSMPNPQLLELAQQALGKLASMNDDA